MPSAIVWKIIKPKHLNANTFLSELLKEARAIGSEILADFRKTVRTWTNKPRFQKIVTVEPTGISILAGTDDEIYAYVNDGTKVRYALMTKDFKPKSKVRHVGSFKGRGGLAYISRKHPRPGIEARKFDEEIQKSWTTKFRERMIRALERGINGSGHAL